MSEQSEVERRVLDWFRAYAHEPSDKPTGYWIEFGADDSPEIQSLVALVHDTQHCDCGAKAIREAESLREQLAGVTATCEGHKLEQTRRRELAEAERDAAIKERDALKLAVAKTKTEAIFRKWGPLLQRLADGPAEPTREKEPDARIGEPCEVCFHVAWEPVPPDYQPEFPDDIVLGEGTDKRRCGYCWHVNHYKSLIAKLRVPLKRLEPILLAMSADEANAPAFEWGTLYSEVSAALAKPEPAE